MQLRLERHVFRQDFVNAETGDLAYSAITHHSTREVTISLAKRAASRDAVVDIASICCREILFDTIELHGPGVPASVPTLSSNGKGEVYLGSMREHTKVKARDYVRKLGKKY
jgi:hypothetical protein